MSNKETIRSHSEQTAPSTHMTLTHSYFLKSEEAQKQKCQTCNELLAVKYILLNCKKYETVRINL